MSGNAVATRWLSVNEAAEILQISPKTVYEQASRGEIRSRKIGSRRLIDPSDVLPAQAPIPQKEKIQPESTVNIDLLLANIDHALTLLQQAKAALQEVNTGGKAPQI